MTAPGLLQIAVYSALLVLLAVPLGLYMARVYRGEASVAGRLLGPVERALYRSAGVDPAADMTWRRYAVSVLLFNLAGAVLVFALQRLQAALPGNPNQLAAVDPRVAFNTAISFASNTNWQSYGGETTMSHLVQTAALTTQNFVSAATGMAVLVALVRGFTRRHAQGIGSFWVDLTRSTLYVLIPLSMVTALVLVWQGVPQTTDGRVAVALVQGGEQGIAVGPVASQIAIKQLGTNGGGYYNANAAHPLENPTPLSNLVELLAILLIPVALCFTFGALVNARRQGRALLAAMALVFAPLLGLTLWHEQAGNPVLTPLGVDQVASALHGGGNMEGKEVRFGIAASSLWATATTAASSGSVNAMHDSFTPLGGLSPMVLMGLGEVVFGGVGSGLYGMLMFAIVAVFIAGLMVGRTPELLGKKIEAHEMKMASVAILVPCIAALLGAALACVTDEGVHALGNPGAHGFSEILYAFLSGANNNGSALAGLTASGTFYATALGLCMWVGRYWVIVAVLAVAGSLAAKKIVPPSSGTLPTDTPLFVVMLIGVVLLVGLLNFIPALALGPIAEHLQLP
jgi:K+-transporting ATPase ATPase A chain